MTLIDQISERAIAIFSIPTLRRGKKSISINVKSKSDPNLLSHIVSKCDTIMEQKRIFLDQDLNISHLSQIVGTNRSYISKAINIKKSMSFCDYINLYRSEYAKIEVSKMVDSGEWLSMEEVAIISGFTCSRNMNKYFKKFYGYSPLTYRNIIEFQRNNTIIALS